MKVILAKKAGFCMGVRRAVDMTLELAGDSTNRPISTFGPLIHNPQFLNYLKDKGVGVLDKVPGDTPPNEGTVIIRAHGVPPERKSALSAAGLNVEDATCPRVVKVQAIIKRQQKEGRSTIIIGDRNHAEVEGLLGYADKDSFVVSTREEARAVSLNKPYIIVSQTTQDERFFNELVDIIRAKHPECLVFNTICDSTHKRQDEVRELCKKVDALVVVGGKNSANTTRLGVVAQFEGVDVFVVETKDELDIAAMGAYKCVGVTAGASTPTWVINGVVERLESL